MANPVEFDQVQGIVRFGYRKLTECTLLLLAIRDTDAAQQWLRTAPVTSAVAMPDAPETALQIALTHEGLRTLGCAADLLAQFSLEFQSGPADPSRARLLGDVGSSAPQRWAWGAEPDRVDLLVMLYARPGKLAAWQKQIATPAWEQAFQILTELTTSDLDGVEPFGFPDGLSQPELDWEAQRTPHDTEDTYINRISLGEFLLGYTNEYRRYTDRPLLPTSAGNAALLPAAEDQPGMRDFGRNGTYLVLRTLEQDVKAFWNYVRAQAASEQEGEALAAAMVGRNKDGTPLVPLSPDTMDGIDQSDANNHFNFDSDPQGTACPFGAHIRRANPRNGDLPSPRASGLKRLLALVGLAPNTLHSDSKASSRFHRILRRGREYGPAAPTDTRAPRGIHFLCFNANIARQFEFLQNAWINSTKSDGMSDESDPLLGSREPISGAAPADTFSRPQPNGPSQQVCGMPRFITVRGAGYFFLPSIPALRYLSATANTSPAQLGIRPPAT